MILTVSFHGDIAGNGVVELALLLVLEVFGAKAFRPISLKASTFSFSQGLRFSRRVSLFEALGLH